MTASPPIRLTDVAVGYDGVAVIDHLDLTIDTGEAVVVLGANGSGKSTLVRGILGLAEIHRGTIELFGTPSARFGERWRIGYVPQRTVAAGAIPASVTEMVASGRLPRLGLGRRFGAVDRAAVQHALATVEMADAAGRNIADLSGGQQRRVMIARALAAEPDLLVLDEPTAGVDAESQQRLAATLAHLRADGATIVLIAHELGPFAGLVDRAVVMRDGGIAFDGDPGDPGCEHLHEHGHEPPRPGTGLVGW